MQWQKCRPRWVAARCHRTTSHPTRRPCKRCWKRAAVEFCIFNFSANSLYLTAECNRSNLRFLCFSHWEYGFVQLALFHAYITFFLLQSVSVLPNKNVLLCSLGKAKVHSWDISDNGRQIISLSDLCVEPSVVHKAHDLPRLAKTFKTAFLELHGPRSHIDQRSSGVDAIIRSINNSAL